MDPTNNPKAQSLGKLLLTLQALRVESANPRIFFPPIKWVSYQDTVDQLNKFVTDYIGRVEDGVTRRKRTKSLSLIEYVKKYGPRYGYWRAYKAYILIRADIEIKAGKRTWCSTVTPQILRGWKHRITRGHMKEVKNDAI